MASFTGFDPAALDFLRGLGEHNDRAWFEAHRADYEGLLLAPARELVIALGERLTAIAPGLRADPRVNGSILRINRDTRFSNDKRPYKTHLDLWLWEGDGRLSLEKRVSRLMRRIEPLTRGSARRPGA